MQEGWHYHIEDADDPITYNGVVYNEMQGVYSSPDEILAGALNEALYPDTIYSGESGGHPDHIPDLTYEDFLAFHRKYYHPSNSYIYFYGDGDVAQHLTYLDREYLSAYTREPVTSQIPLQPVFDAPVSHETTYPISAGEDLENKDYLAVGWMLPGSCYEDMLMMDILGHILLENNSGPLKKALLDLNICKEIDYNYSVSMQQPAFMILLKNTDAKYKPLVEETITKVLKQLIETGLNADDVAAGINSAEFNLREGDMGHYPKGLILGLELFDTWLYDDAPDPFKPFDHIKYNRTLKAIRERADRGGFEQMMADCFIQNPHRAIVTMTPDVNQAAEREQALAEKLAAYKASLSGDEIATLVNATNTLKEHQGIPDSPEALATIPKLSLDEIDKKARDLSYCVETCGDNTLIWHPNHTNGIVYVKLYFDTHGVPLEDLKYLSLFNKFLGELDTEHYSLTQLTREIEINTGEISGNITLYNHLKDFGTYKSFLCLKGKALTDSVPKLMDLMREIATGTLFEDDKLMHDLLGQIRLDKEDHFLTAGHATGVQRLQSYYSDTGAIADVTDGISFYRFIVDLDEHYEARKAEMKAKLSEMASRIITRNNAIVSLSCEPSDKAVAVAEIAAMLATLPAGSLQTYTYQFDQKINNEGFKAAAKIQYVSQGYNYRKCGYDYTGTLAVLKSVLYTGYLWIRVRVQGGAYGGMFGVNRAGDLYFTSYRDPNLAETFEVYAEAADYIETMTVDPRELEKYIIGTISNKDMPLSPAMMMDATDRMYFNGLTQADLQQERDEILNTTEADLRQTAGMIRDCMAQHCVCVIGGEEAVESCSDHFKSTPYLFGNEK